MSLFLDMLWRVWISRPVFQFCEIWLSSTLLAVSFHLKLVEVVLYVDFFPFVSWTRLIWAWAIKHRCMSWLTMSCVQLLLLCGHVSSFIILTVNEIRKTDSEHFILIICNKIVLFRHSYTNVISRQREHNRPKIN